MAFLAWLCRYDLLPGKSGELRKAEQIALTLLKYQAVSAIQLFGSIARKGYGSDIDLIAIVPEEMAKAFIETFMACGGDYPHSAWARREAAEQMLDIELDSQTDIFLFPANWQKNERFRSSLPCEDPNFLANIACDAIQFDPDRAEFGSLARIWSRKYTRNLRWLLR